MFDDRLKQLRIQKGISMRQVALKLNIPYTTYVSYEKNEREPNSETLIMIANFFDCSIDFLIGRSTKIKMIDFEISEFNNELTEHERKVIIAYRSHISEQATIDKILDIEPEVVETKKQA